MRSETAGCWTCRVRHLKCDLHIPSCKECSDRHVHCHGYGPKPTWMDGASEEQKERQRIKAAINENFRRVKKMQGRARRRAREQSQALSETQTNEEAPRAMITPPQPSYSPCLSGQSDFLEHSVEQESHDTSQDTNPDHDEAPHSWTDSGNQHLEPGDSLDSREACLLMHYLDQVFPWQFPYHCSRSSLGNRGWLFLLLIKRGPLYHAVLSLSSLHQAAILGTEEEFQQKQKAFEHHSRALRELCDIMSEKGDKLLDDHPQLAEFLACSFMLISFEVFRGAEHDWLLHLDATASLMGLLSPEAIFNPDSVICDTSSTPFAEQYRSPKSGMVEGLQFLTVAVIWFDIFACVATGRAPRLPYQQWLQIQGLNTADLMGCENWVMLIIGDLAHFSIWKETQEEQGMLSIRELASRGKEIERRLESGIQDLDLARCAQPGAESSTNWVSRLFAYAALVLLHTIVSGPLPALPEIQSAVSRAIITLQNRPQGYSLTGSVWALCVIGCMAQLHNRPLFEMLMTDLVQKSGRIGNSATVWKIIRKCWEMQETKRADCRITMSEMGVQPILI